MKSEDTSEGYFVVVTVDATQDIAFIHDRMPAILSKQSKEVLKC